MTYGFCVAFEVLIHFLDYFDLPGMDYSKETRCHDVLC